MKAVRGLNVASGRIPEYFEEPLDSLKYNGNPWLGVRDKRLEWAGDLAIPAFTPEHDYCLFTCCTTAYDPSNREAGQVPPPMIQVTEKPARRFPNCWNMQGFLLVHSVQKRVAAVIRLTR